MGHAEDHDDGYVPLYSRPLQRQRWGETQILPHTDWSDTFFDLFYVGAAYNLGTLIREDPTSMGVLYFVAIVLAIQNIWIVKMYFTSRFAISDDVYHKMYEFAGLIVLGTVVLHIRPVALLSDSKHSMDMFCLSLSLTLASILGWGRSIEVFFKGIGEPALKIAVYRDILWSIPYVACYFAATIVAGLDFYGNNDSTTIVEHIYDYEEGFNGTQYDINETKEVHDDDDHHHRFRFLGESTTSTENHIPIYLVFAGSVLYVLLIAVHVWTLPGGGKHKEVIVPMNVGWAIHRWGEFTMLMLGESILSLLIVDVSEGKEYYLTFFAGIISITLLEYLHFRSQPHSADDHALRRSKESSIVFTSLMQLYCAALVSLGTAYKMLLYEYMYAAKEVGTYRKLVSSNNFFVRLLAGSESIPKFSTKDRQQRVSHFFCVSMAIVWLCSDLMIISHRGINDNMGKCRCSHTGTLKVVTILLFVLRVALIAFIATLSQWMTDPLTLVMIGLVGIICQVLLRVIGTAYFGPEFDYDSKDDNSLAEWPNVTQPKVQDDDNRRKVLLHQE